MPYIIQSIYEKMQIYIYMWQGPLCIIWRVSLCIVFNLNSSAMAQAWGVVAAGSSSGLGLCSPRSTSNSPIPTTLLLLSTTLTLLFAPSYSHFPSRPSPTQSYSLTPMLMLLFSCLSDLSFFISYPPLLILLRPYSCSSTPTLLLLSYSSLTPGFLLVLSCSYSSIPSLWFLFSLPLVSFFYWITHLASTPALLLRLLHSHSLAPTLFLLLFFSSPSRSRHRGRAVGNIVVGIAQD